MNLDLISESLRERYGETEIQMNFKINFLKVQTEKIAVCTFKTKSEDIVPQTNFPNRI